MHRTQKLMIVAAIFSMGYLAGQAQVGTQPLTAQESTTGVAEDTANKIREANRALTDAMESLISDGMYESIIDGPNAFLVLSGGGNAQEDLESGRGVDPETFAGLYAGRATPEIQALLGVDDQGRITYNNEVVRMYSKSRLQRVQANRIRLTEGAF